MTALNEVRIMNETMLLYLKKLGMSYKRNEIIDKILKDESCFFKMSKDDAYIILNDVGIQNENIDSIYLKLTSSDCYDELYKNGKIDENDSELVIKYKIYNPDNIFSDRKIIKGETSKTNQISIIEHKEPIFTKIIYLIKKLFTK